MVDTLTAEQRSACMRAVRSKDTSPEMRVRKLAHSMGYRYALHSARLPGKPDLVFKKYRSVIFVHGCFWHLHSGCREGRTPNSNQDYWHTKLARNVARDSEHEEALKRAGWRVMVIWECELHKKSPAVIREQIRLFLNSKDIETS
jgi:DNA mismatch endonuclease (patch repair protein)